MTAKDMSFLLTDSMGVTHRILLEYPPDPAPLYRADQSIRMGLVIGTYSSVPYVHLGLESWRRNYPHFPVLVHDDCSPAQSALKAVCQEYGVSFETNSIRKRHALGDFSAFLGGLLWAQRQGIDLLVKFSRRFIPLYDWTESLRRLAMESQEATFSNICLNLNWGFRSEVVAMHVPSWLQHIDKIKTDLLTRDDIFVEGTIHNYAKAIKPCQACADYRTLHPAEDWHAGYCEWPIMGKNRVVKVDGVLWHHSTSPAEYFTVAKEWGLPYSEASFVIPDSHIADQ